MRKRGNFDFLQKILAANVEPVSPAAIATGLWVSKVKSHISYTQDLKQWISQHSHCLAPAAATKKMFDGGGQGTSVGDTAPKGQGELALLLHPFVIVKLRTWYDCFWPQPFFEGAHTWREVAESAARGTFRKCSFPEVTGRASDFQEKCQEIWLFSSWAPRTIPLCSSCHPSPMMTAGLRWGYTSHSSRVGVLGAKWGTFLPVDSSWDYSRTSSSVSFLTVYFLTENLCRDTEGNITNQKRERFENSHITSVHVVLGLSPLENGSFNSHLPSVPSFHESPASSPF